MEPWRPQRLTPAQLEEGRRTAAQLLRNGGASQAEIARGLGVSRAAVTEWKHALEQRGLRALDRRPHSGRPPRLSEEQWRTLRRLLHRGWSPQRPVPRAKEREEALVEAWLRRDWPRIKKGLVDLGASLPSWTKQVTHFGPA
ncbi:MAG TPA: helix-turn-helix domain-containing protein [Gemmatimonadales bacterium]|nr:helix-turn-helix domain-containing protein [Gemmatimonadales bacterium]